MEGKNGVSAEVGMLVCIRIAQCNEYKIKIKNLKVIQVWQTKCECRQNPKCWTKKALNSEQSVNNEHGDDE